MDDSSRAYYQPQLNNTIEFSSINDLTAQPNQLDQPQQQTHQNFYQTTQAINPQHSFPITELQNADSRAQQQIFYQQQFTMSHHFQAAAAANQNSNPQDNRQIYYPSYHWY